MVQQQQTTALGVLVAFQVLGSIFVALRIWSRLVLSRGDKGKLMILSDVFVTVGWVFSVGQTFCLYQFTVAAHSGYHIEEFLPGGMFFTTDPSGAVQVNIWAWAMGLLYNPILTCVKNAAILFYLRLGISKQHLRFACYAFLVINNCIFLGVLISDALQCTPTRYIWDAKVMDAQAQLKAGADANGMVNGKLIKGGKCINFPVMVLTSAGLTCLTDLLVIAIPISMVWGLQMKTRKKVMVAMIFCLALFVTIAGVIRLPIMYWVMYKMPTSKDPTYSIGGNIISAIETGLALMTVCVPDLLPLAKQYMPKIFGRSTTADNYGPTGYGSNSRNLRSAKKSGYTKTDSKTDSKATPGYPNKPSEHYQMDNMSGWDRNRATMTTAKAYGGYPSPSSSLAGSEEAIVIIDGKQQIVKTTQITTQSLRIEEGER